MRPSLRSCGGLPLLALLVVSCGGGGGGGGGGSPNAHPSANVTTPSSPAGGDVVVDYTIADAEGDVASVLVEFSINGGSSYSPATPGLSSEATTGLATSPGGAPHSFTWNSLLDGVGTSSAVTTVRVRITPSDASAGTAGATASFTVDNSSNTPPSAGVTTPASTQSGLVALSFTLTDAESSACSVALEFSTNSGGTFAPASIGPGADGAGGLGSSPGGTAHVVVWNSFADGVGLGGAVGTVRLRLTPSDGSAGSAAATTDFAVNNGSLVSGGLLAGFPVTSDPSTVDDEAVAVATDGKFLYVVGRQGDSSGDDKWRIEKRDGRTGATVAGFGSGGVLVIDPSGGSDEPTDALVAGSSLFVVGWMDNTPFGNEKRDVRIVKLALSDGSPDSGFGSGGAVTIDVDDGNGAPPRLASDGTNLYVAFADHVPGGAPGDFRLRVEKRGLANGALVSGFGSGGVLVRNLGALADGALAVATDGTNLYLAEAENLTVENAAVSNASVRIEKRSLSSGALVSGFGSGGVVTEDLSTHDDMPCAIVIDGSSFYLLVQNGTPGAGVWQWRYEKRALSDGSLTTSAAGTATSDAHNQVGGLAVVGSALYATTYAGTGSDRAWRIEKRAISDLALVSGFGSGGIVTSNPTSGDDRSVALVATGGVVFVVGRDDGGSPSEWRIEARWK